MKKYREIEFGFMSLDFAIKELKNHEDLVCGSFNGKMLYSDIDNVDSAYKKVTGKTKNDFEAECEKQRLKYEEHRRKHKEYIPELTKKWIEKGKQILDKKYHESWKKCVPIRLNDL